MRKISVYQIDAFTGKPFSGNPAAVIKINDLSDKEMQLIASEMNLSETAFLGNSDKADYKLRWFTPALEVDLCGHATIASLHYLRETGELRENSEVTFDTRSGILRCSYEDNLYYMQIPSYNYSEYNLNRDEILSYLGISEKDCEEKFILLENGYLYIYIKSLNVLGSLKPQMTGIKKLISSGVEAVVVYTLETKEPESSAHLRFFGPYYGINEDPVTGSANGPLLQLLCQTGKLKYSGEVQFEQGDFICRPGRVKVMYKDKNIFIAGNAVTVLKGEIIL
jgi:trans-2,3-dihydro-3-hydroxyanthranilate isomerase